MRIEIDNKSWYYITDFDSYEEIAARFAKLDCLAYRLAGRVGC